MTIIFRIRIRPVDGGGRDLLDFLESSYVPALSVQRGWQAARIVRSYDRDDLRAIGASDGELPVELEFQFATEADRLRWVDSPEHQVLWPQLIELTQERVWCGFTTVAAQGDYA